MTLTISEKLILIKEISKRLSTEDWPLIDVTLKQFSLPTTDTWSGTKDGYILETINSASDGILLELGHHVGFYLGAEKNSIDPPFWQKGMFRLFISHLSSNRSYAADLQASLLLHGVSSFVAHNDIEPTKEWQTEIETALATCDSLVALLHKDFHQSNWTDQEIGFAMGRGLPVFAVKFDHDPYGFIGRFQAFDGNNKKPFELAAELFDTFRKHKQTQGRMAQALIALFETSESFSLSKTLINYSTFAAR